MYYTLNICMYICICTVRMYISMSVLFSLQDKFLKHFAAKGATEVDEAGKIIYAALLKVCTQSLNIPYSTHAVCTYVDINDTIYISNAYNIAHSFYVTRGLQISHIIYVYELPTQNQSTLIYITCMLYEIVMNLHDKWCYWCLVICIDIITGIIML